MCVPDDLVGTAAGIAARLEDDTVDDAGLDLNEFVAMLRTVPSRVLHERDGEFRDAMSALGSAGPRVVSWLERHADSPVHHETEARRSFWRNLTLTPAAV